MKDVPDYLLVCAAARIVEALERDVLTNGEYDWDVIECAGNQLEQIARLFTLRKQESHEAL